MSRREDRTQRRVVITRHNRPPATGRFARRPGRDRRANGSGDGSKGPGPNAALPRPTGWRGRLPGPLQRPLAWHAPVAATS